MHGAAQMPTTDTLTLLGAAIRRVNDIDNEIWDSPRPRDAIGRIKRRELLKERRRRIMHTRDLLHHLVRSAGFDPVTMEPIGRECICSLDNCPCRHYVLDF